MMTTKLDVLPEKAMVMAAAVATTAQLVVVSSRERQTLERWTSAR